MNRTLISILSTLFFCNLFAQENIGLQQQEEILDDTISILKPEKPRREIPYNVFDLLRKPDSITNAAANFNQDVRVEQLFIDRQMLNGAGSIAGFRVQVFSSNRQQTAKSEAFRIKALMQEKFPEKGVYESYTSPFWKVRIGDFRSREEAQEFLTHLAKTFPAMRREMYIIPDEIKVSGSK
ncbi:SPOR domain-containing protein [Paludibacter sp. 221]|uniref:SPOR domain-containing protein n=1 Tax=Paludibacter sp. 221 TaxID=2302939 RepID=UPI0013D8A770|nr:SPOR domain-containing protein [Paludibacter sp. 221]